jgi:hypothetical protein
MGIDEVSEKLGALTQGMTNVTVALRDHIDEENRWQDEVDKKLDALIAQDHRRKGMLEEAKRTARVWAAIIGAVMVAAIEFLKHQVFGG